MEIKNYLRQIFGGGDYTEDYLPVIVRNQRIALTQKIYSSV
jgi:hypothetical protein